MLLTLHHVYVFNSDRATIAEEAYKDREANRGLGGGNGQDKKDENLAWKILQVMWEGNEIHIGSEQKEFYRH